MPDSLAMHKVDCLFVHTGLFNRIEQKSFYNIMPIGFVGIADYVSRNGYSVKILNLGLERAINKKHSIVETIIKDNPKVIAISLHWHITMFEVFETIKMIKSSSNAILVIGGITASYFYADILKRYPLIDAIILGYGERSMLEIVKNEKLFFKRRESIPNLVFNDSSTNKLVFTHGCDNYKEYKKCEYSGVERVESKDSHFYEQYNTNSSIIDYLPAAKEITEKVLIPFYRGCTNNCKSCGHKPAFLGIKRPCNQIQFREIALIVKDMQRFKGKKNLLFYLSFDPNIDEQWVLKVFTRLQKLKLKNSVYFESWKLPSNIFILKLSKVFPPDNSGILLSPETFNEKIRVQYKNSAYSNSQLETTIQKIKSCGLSCTLSFTIGIPGETKEDIINTIRYAKQLKKRFNVRIALFPLLIDPGSPYFETPKKYGITLYRKTFNDFLENSRAHAFAKEQKSFLGLRTKELSEEEILDMTMVAYKELYFDVKGLFNRGTKIRSLNSFFAGLMMFIAILKRDRSSFARLLK